MQYKPISFDELVGTGRKEVSILKIDKQVLSDYAAEDADITLKLKNYLALKLDAEPRLHKICTEIEVQKLRD